MKGWPTLVVDGGRSGREDRVVPVTGLPSTNGEDGGFGNQFIRATPPSPKPNGLLKMTTIRGPRS